MKHIEPFTDAGHAVPGERYMLPGVWTPVRCVGQSKRSDGYGTPYVLFLDAWKRQYRCHPTLSIAWKWEKIRNDQTHM